MHVCILFIYGLPVALEEQARYLMTKVIINLMLDLKLLILQSSSVSHCNKFINGWIAASGGTTATICSCFECSPKL